MRARLRWGRGGRGHTLRGRGELRTGWGLATLCLFLAGPGLAHSAEDVALVPRGGAGWRYTEQHPAQAPGEEWRSLIFDDSQWLHGTAPFGYGDEAEGVTYATRLSDNDGDYYFRRVFTVTDLGLLQGRELRLYVASDNAAAVYLNETPVDKDPALRTVDGHEFLYWNRTISLDTALLKRGPNVLAVHVHNNATSTDSYFDLLVALEAGPEARPGWRRPELRRWLARPDIRAGAAAVALGLVLALVQVSRGIPRQHLRKLLRRGEWAQAKRFADRAHLAGRRDWHTQQGLFQLAKHTEDPEGMLRAAQQMAALRPRHVDSLQALGEALLATRRVEEALGTYEALAVRSRQVEHEKTVTRLLMQLKRWPEAERRLEALLSRSPQDLEVIEALGEVKEQKHDPHTATKLYQRLVDLRPQSVTGRFYLAKYQFDAGELDTAIAAFQRLSQEDTRYRPRAYYYLGTCFLKRQAYDLAFESFQKISPDALMRDVLYEVARAFEDQHQDLYAYRLYQALVAHDVTFRDSEARLAQLRRRLEQPDAGALATGDAHTALLSRFQQRTAERYRAFELVGTGGLSLVYKAYDTKLSRAVAVKLFHRGLTVGEDLEQRFLREAKAVASLTHPHIVAIYDVELQHPPYIVMEFIEGTPLDTYLTSHGPVPPPVALAIARQLADALGHSHERGVIHRDVKPANIILDEGRQQIKLTDFGIAKIKMATALTQSGYFVGTPIYVAPEQERGDEVDERADIYAYGITVGELLAGRFRADVSGGTAAAAAALQEWLRGGLAGAPAGLRAVVERCTQREPVARYPSFREVLQALEEVRV